MTLMSDWTDKMVTFDKDMKLRDNLRPETFTASQEWHLHRFVITKSESTHHSEGSSVNNYPMYHMKVFVRRKNGFYLWNVALIVVSGSHFSFKCIFRINNFNNYMHLLYLIGTSLYYFNRLDPEIFEIAVTIFWKEGARNEFLCSNRCAFQCFSSIKRL